MNQTLSRPASDVSGVGGTDKCPLNATGSPTEKHFKTQTHSFTNAFHRLNARFDYIWSGRSSANDVSPLGAAPVPPRSGRR